MRVVFIASLVHSGSTVVDLLLGAHGGFVGVGETWGFLQPDLPHLDHAGGLVCSCGAPMDRCRFWGAVIRGVESRRAAQLDGRYDVLTEVFGEQHPGRALVDSSKSLDALRVWIGRRDVELSVLHLVRDVRAWSLSMRSLSRRSGEYGLTDLLRKHGRRAPRRWVARTMVNRFRQWYIGNREIERFVGAHRLPAFVLSYEALCLHTEATLSRLCAFLGVEPTPAMLSIGDSASHVALGNRMLRDEHRRSRLLYDDGWRGDLGWALPAALLRPVMRYNRSRVYAGEGGRS